MAKRGGKVSYRQREKILDFLEMHPELISGRFTATFTKQVHYNLWNELKTQLNSDGSGAVKDVPKWKKCWTSWKSETKTKISNGKKKVTGGGEREDVDLSSLEIRLAAIIGNVVIEGNPLINEAGVPQIPQNLLTHNSEATFDVRPIGSNVRPIGPEVIQATIPNEGASTQAHLNPQSSSSVQDNLNKQTSVASSCLASTSKVQHGIDDDVTEEYTLAGYNNVGGFSFLSQLQKEANTEPIFAEINDESFPRSAEQLAAISKLQNQKMCKSSKKRKFVEEKSHLEKATEALSKINESKVDALKQMKQSKVEALKSIEKALLKRVDVEERKARALEEVAVAVSTISTAISVFLKNKD